MMRILYLTQWFHPEPGIVKGADFIRAIEAAGHGVKTVTGFPNYPEGRLYPGYRMRPWAHETIEGVRVTRLPLYPSHNSSSTGRALNFLSFFVSVLAYGLIRGRRHDLVYVYHPPITVGLAAALFAPLWGRRFILEIQDLWPDTVAASGMAGTGRLARILGGMCNFVYRRAAHIIVQSHGMGQRLAERGVPSAKVSVIHNWADAAASTVAPTATREPGTSLRLLYAGNLGRMQALDVAIRATAIAAGRGADVVLTLMGDGIDADALKALAQESSGDRIRFLPRVPVSEVPTHMARADALLMHLAADPLFEITIPSKTQFYLAAGKPIVAGIDGEAATILRESGAALVAPAGDAEALADAIVALAAEPQATLALRGRSGRAYYDSQLSFEAGIQATLAVIAAAGVDSGRSHG